MSITQSAVFRVVLNGSAAFLLQKLCNLRATGEVVDLVTFGKGDNALCCLL